MSRWPQSTEIFGCTGGWSDNSHCDVSSTGCQLLGLISRRTAIACPAVDLRVGVPYKKIIPDLAVQRRKVTMVMWWNGIFLKETQVGDLHFVYGRGGSV